MMAYKHHVFISYARVNDAHTGWVLSFKEKLEGKLREKLPGGTAQVYLDVGEIGVGPLKSELQAAVSSSAILLVILSNRWLERPWCQQELALFVEAAGGPSKAPERIVSVRIEDVKQDRLPKVLQDCPLYDFFTIHPTRKVTLTYGFPEFPELESDYWLSMLELVGDEDRPGLVTRLFELAIEAVEASSFDKTDEKAFPIQDNLPGLALRYTLCRHENGEAARRTHPTMKSFDVFLSYKSDDSAWVGRIKTALQSRGVQVWLDRDQIRPGDHFAAALESGLESSRSVALIVTPRSMKSNWVKDEYYRALSLNNEGSLQLIPMLLGDASLPGFLSTRQFVSIKSEAGFERGIDRLIWPGITGKQIACFAVSGYLGCWEPLMDAAEAEGLNFTHREDIHRSGWHLDKLLSVPDALQRKVVFVDPFEGRPARLGCPRATVSEYINFIIKHRERTRGSVDELVFVLYNHPEGWERVDEVLELPQSLVDRMKHYFTLHQTLDGSELRTSLREVWHKVQRDLLLKERG